MSFKDMVKIAAVCLAVATGNVNAKALTEDFANAFDVTSIFLWSDDPSNMTLNKASFTAGMTGWQTTLATGAALVLSGPAIDSGDGRFSVKFKFRKQPFKLQWAEVLFDGTYNQVMGSGTLQRRGPDWLASSTFTHLGDIPNLAPVPLPSSIALLLSALVFVPMSKLRRRAAAMA